MANKGDVGQQEDRVAELHAAVKAKEAEHKALEAEYEEADKTLSVEAEELVAFARERGHLWVRYHGRRPNDDTHLQGFLYSYVIGALWSSEHKLKALTEARRKAKRERRARQSKGEK